MAKTFDQYLAESGQQSTLDSLRKQGQYDSARTQYERTGSYGNSRSSSAAPAQSQQSSPSESYQDTVRNAIEMNQRANQPAIQSLEASLPETQQRFAQQRSQAESKIEPLKQRYSQLLSDIKGQGEQSANQQTRITSGELGKRGIVGSSTLAQQEIQNAVDPIFARTQSATKELGLQQEQDIKGIQDLVSSLGLQETDAMRAVRNAIAQLQSGAAQSGVSQGLSLYQQNQQNEMAKQAQAIAQRQQELENARTEQLFPLQLQSAQADLQAKLAANKSGSSSHIPFQSKAVAQPQAPGGFSIGSNVMKLLKGGNVKDAINLALNP